MGQRLIRVFVLSGCCSDSSKRIQEIWSSGTWPMDKSKTAWIQITNLVVYQPAEWMSLFASWHPPWRSLTSCQGWQHGWWEDRMTCRLLLRLRLRVRWPPGSVTLLSIHYFQLTNWSICSALLLVPTLYTLRTAAQPSPNLPFILVTLLNPKEKQGHEYGSIWISPLCGLTGNSAGEGRDLYWSRVLQRARLTVCTVSPLRTSCWFPRGHLHRAIPWPEMWTQMLPDRLLPVCGGLLRRCRHYAETNNALCSAEWVSKKYGGQFFNYGWGGKGTGQPEYKLYGSHCCLMTECHGMAL